MKTKLFLMLLLAGVLSASAGAEEVAIVNPGFEDPVLDDGGWTSRPTGWEEGWYEPDGWPSWPSYVWGAGATNPDAGYGYDGIAPEGENVAYVTPDLTYDGGLHQILADTLQADMIYELSVLVGNPGGYNGGLPTCDYRIELLAGGVVVATTNDKGLFEGDPSPAPDTWTTASLTFVADPDHPQVGKALEIRLIAVDFDAAYELNFDDVKLNAYTDPMKPSPANGEYVYAGDVELSWTNMDPNTPGDDVYVDVWFGIDPNSNKPANWDDYVAAGKNTTTVTVPAPIIEPAPTTYYWQVNSYINGSAAGDPIEGRIYKFYATTDIPPSAEIVSADMITWSGESVQLDGTVEDDEQSGPLSYSWSTAPADGVAGVSVVFDPDAFVEDPEVTISKIPGVSLISIVNPGFEDPELEDGDWTYRPEGWKEGWYETDGSPSWPAYEWGAGIQNPDPNYGYEGIAPEGENIAFVTPDAGYDGGLHQILADTLQAGTTYELSVLVGNPSAYNGGGLICDYRIELAAGGVVVASTNDKGLFEGDPSPAPDTWTTASLTFAPEPNHPELGEALEIRLIAVDYEAIYELNFDDVKLIASGEGAPHLTVELTLEVDDHFNPSVEDTMTIDVYDDACSAAIGAGVDNPSDISANCITGLEDLAEMLLTWTADNSLTEPKFKEPPAGAVADVFSLNFYMYPWPWASADYETITVEEEQSAGFDTWLTDGWMNMEIPWDEDEQPPVTITSSEGAEATYTLIHARNGGAYWWDYPRTTLLGDGNGDMMDGHANGTEDADELVDMTISDIPFGVYDVIIYVGSQEAQFGDGTGKFVFNGGPEQDFTLTSGIFDGTFTEIVDATTPGNYILFENVTGDSFTLQMWGNGFNHIGPCGLQFGNSDRFNISPADGGFVHPADELELSWTNMEPSNPGDDLYVDVWFGTEPNELNPAFEFEKVVEAGKNTTSVTVEASTLGEIYYWQVNSYLNGSGNINDPNMVEGPLWRFYTVTDVPVSVNAGYDAVAWSGQEVQLDGTVKDYGEGDVVGISWSANPDDGVVFSDPNALNPIVTITKATDNPSIVTLTLSAEDGISSDEDRMRIEIYDTACLAAIGEGEEYDAGDFDADCATGLEDYAVIAEEWLVNSELTEPVEKP
jgi:hypothetical protein